MQGQSGNFRLYVGLALLAAAAGGVAWYLQAPAPPVEAAAPSLVPKAAEPVAPPAANAPAPTAAAVPLPPTDMPLKQAYAELQAGMNRGDAAATSRLYRDLNRCIRAKAVIRANTRFADDVLTQRPDPATGSPESQLDQAAKRMENSDRLKKLCDGVDDAMLRTTAAVTLRAAQLGDTTARTCYVHRGPFMNPQEMIEHPESVGTYRAQAPALIEDALRQGDWRMVDMLQYAYSPRSVSMLSGLVGHDDVQYYRYLKLFRLGADARSIKRIDKELTDAAGALTPEQIAQGDDWAKGTFERDFRGVSSEAAPQRWDACATPED